MNLPIYEKPETSIGTIKRHKLAHLGEIAVGESLLTARLSASCDSNNCPSTCCGTGVLADRVEKERILAHAAEILATMDPDQPQDPSKWFDDEEVKDPDFPSGVAIGTQTMSRGCIFLNQKMRCVLQKAQLEGRVPVLKPFYCFAYPVTIDRGMVMLDIDNVEGSPRCCEPTKDGTKTALDVFGFELEHVLGAEGVAELREVLAKAAAATGL